MTASGYSAGGFSSERHELPDEDVRLQDMRLQDMVLDSQDIAAFLTELAVAAASRLSTPGNPVHCGVTVIRHKRPEAVASNDAEAHALDELQNGFEDGPCLTALRTKTPLLVPNLVREHRWHAYARAAVAEGVSSVLAVPMDLAGEAEAVLNLYSGRVNGFSTDDVAAAEAFAGQTAGALRLVLRITQLSEAKSDLALALKSRTIIDMAVGAVMAENRCSRDTAFGILTKASNTRNIKLREVAAAVIRSISGEKEIDTYFDE